MKIYKLTRVDGTTNGDMQWGEGFTNTVEWGGYLCGPGCLHGYRSPELAVFLRLLHVDSDYTELWECSTPEILADDGLKIGMASITTIKKIPMPQPTTEQRIEFAIRCAMLVYKDEAWTKWATDWLECKDRSARAARAAADAARAAADAAYAAYAASAAVYSAGAAYDGKFSRDLNRIAKKVMKGN